MRNSVKLNVFGFVLVWTALFLPTLPAFAHLPIGGSIAVDDAISIVAYNILDKDYQTFLNFPFKSIEDVNSIDLKQALNTHPADQHVQDALEQWLKTGLHFIVSDSINETLYVAGQITGSTPSLQKTAIPTSAVEENFLMANYGALKHFSGLQMNTLFAGLFWQNANAIPIYFTSPKVGMIEVYANYFALEASPDLKRVIHSESLSLVRFSTWLHEVAHSRGTGFLHVQCPATLEIDEKYHGKTTCDLSKNGPNAIKGLFLKLILDTCHEMTLKNFVETPEICRSQPDLDFIQNHMQHSLSRVIGDEIWDASWEDSSILDTLLKPSKPAKQHKTFFQRLKHLLAV